MHCMTQKSVSLALLIPCLLLVVCVDTSFGQLFSGQRGLGNPIRARQGTLVTGNEGTIQGTERFLRDNRDRREFVGSDRNEQQGFVGSEQALGTGRVRTSVESLRDFRDRSSRINRPIELPATDEPYLPRLTVDFTVDRSLEHQQALQAERRLNHSRVVANEQRISVSVVNRQATLRGEVTSEEDVARLEILLSFEPGIDEIVNELVVVPPNAPSAARRRTPLPLPPKPSSVPEPPRR
jgi:hypothetical protein